jgi:hypothetical protein
LAVGGEIVPIDEFEVINSSDTIYVIPVEEEGKFYYAFIIHQPSLLLVWGPKGLYSHIIGKLCLDLPLDKV